MLSFALCAQCPGVVQKGLLQKTGPNFVLLPAALSGCNFLLRSDFWRRAEFNSGQKNTITLFSQPLKNQAEVNNFLAEYPNCTEIQGNLEVLYISGGNITSLSPLSNLRKVHGDCSVIDTYADLDVLNIDSIFGNFQAKDVVLADTLSPYLDLNTFQLLAASHPISEIRLDGNALRFSFLGIYLPDSNSNEAESHGFVQFRLAQKANLEHQASIRNSAAIYFDQNPPIFTNTVDRVVFDPPVSVAEAGDGERRIWLFPNPSDDYVYFQSGFAPSFYYLFNSGGQLARRGAVHANRLDLSGLPAGFYGVGLVVEGEVYRGTFVKR